MNIKGSCGVGCTLFVLLLVAPSVFGQDLNPQVAIFGGGSFLKGERTFTVDREPFRSGFANGGKVGFRAAVDLTSHWGVEGAYSFSGHNLRIFELERVPPRERAFGVRVHQFTGNAWYFLSSPREGIRPFATAGLGLARFSPTSQAKAVAAAQEFVHERAVISSKKLDFNFGVGQEVKAADWFGVRLDFRDHVTGIPRFGVPQAPAGPGGDFLPVSGAVHDLEASVGLLIYLKR